jgi:hypothetical protein
MSHDTDRVDEPLDFSFTEEPARDPEAEVFLSAIIAAYPVMLKQYHRESEKDLEADGEPSPWDLLKTDHNEPAVYDKPAKAALSAALMLLENYRAVKWRGPKPTQQTELFK